MVLRRPGRGVDVVAAEEGAEFQRGVEGQGCKILVAEGDDFTLRDEEGQLRFSRGRELRELGAVHFGADGGREVLDSRAGGEEVGELCVGCLAVLNVGEFF